MTDVARFGATGNETIDSLRDKVFELNHALRDMAAFYETKLREGGRNAEAEGRGIGRVHCRGCGTYRVTDIMLCPTCVSAKVAVACADRNAENGEGAETEVAALRVEVKALHETLREVAIEAGKTCDYCRVCGRGWTDEENHNPDCLARQR